ncbi:MULTISPECIES: GntR family transcriptional regulator [Halomonas]|uniref:GntR family transcriptional regulator n=1 Tax=Halomonas TaxID=2745 RepID=UPI001A8F7298|nr:MULTISPECIES: GntR family transcriptional regulator [Halomonas]MEE3215757.1 GntR family transcriptional regulator [Pseudomonadota bacterium]MBN8413814.1 GntR family transcriptional regulator [Halomonas litopenaei]MBY5926655.1 GntR family transcriptional regulator [Halomonas sp. DP4Y7-2]MBY5967738.1 GntR family transcriptional regulator [Halomonas denitrificans]MBY5983240.1 GntR family transcriptional regulator [Halomonas sp. DP5Y7-2]
MNEPAKKEVLSAPRAAPLKRSSLYEAVAERLRDMVMEGELAPGSRIAEKSLCEAFGVSPTPLRQALKVLASEGLVEMLPHRGARVTTVDREEVRDLFEVMAALESLAGNLLVVRASDTDIAQVRALHDEMMEHFNANRRPQYFALNQQIHARLAELSGNRVLKDLEQSLTLRITRARYVANLDSARWEESAREHTYFVEALEARDAQALSEALSLHMRKTGQAILQGLPASP